ncbi:MAG: sensor histidine kinase, partial [Ginsengibacter sp.]
TDSATMYLKLAKSLSDSLSIEERKNLLAFLDVVVDEQAKLGKLEEEKIQTKSKIRTYSMIAGLVILSLIGLILYRNNKKEKKAKIVLEKTLRELKSTQSQLIQSEKMASLGELTAGIAHEIQNPLNFVNNFSEVSNDLINEMKDELKKGNYDDANEIADDVKQNLEKINHHGRRASDIVKGMLQHSRTSTGVKEPTDINALADEYLRLSYHGLRAKDKSFNATMKTDFNAAIGKINIIPQDIGRVLLNLYNNAFYACAERSQSVVDQQKDKNPISYQPTVSVTTKKSENSVLITVSDNGNGIPQNIIDKIFQPFFTTKPTGQGTGLGLSLSYDIIKA